MRSGDHPHTMLGESIRAFAEEIENVTQRLAMLESPDGTRSPPAERTP